MTIKRPESTWRMWVAVTLLAATVVFLVPQMGCTSAIDEPQIADSTAVALLGELHIARARSEIYGSDLQAAIDSLYGAFGLDSAAYNQLLDYYAERPETYATIYAGVLDYVAEHWSSRPASYIPPRDSSRAL